MMDGCMSWGSCTHAMPPPKISRPCQQRQEAISHTSPQPQLEPFPNKYLPPPAPAAAPTRRRVGLHVPRVHLSVTAATRVGLHLWRAGEITRPHHHHPPHREKIFFSPLLAPRHLSLFPSASPAAPPRNLRTDAAGCPRSASD
jgi:hypothetical protein